VVATWIDLPHFLGTANDELPFCAKKTHQISLVLP
jgi:hypothetical protein